MYDPVDDPEGYDPKELLRAINRVADTFSGIRLPLADAIDDFLAEMPDAERNPLTPLLREKGRQLRLIGPTQDLTNFFPVA